MSTSTKTVANARGKKKRGRSSRGKRRPFFGRKAEVHVRTKGEWVRGG